MKRKVVKLGPSTLVISLPAKWTKKLGVKAGQEVEVDEREHNLIITSKPHTQALQTELDITGIDLFLRWLTAMKYISGYDEIRVVFDDLKKARIVEKRARDFIGMEAVSHGKNHMILKQIAEVKEDSFEPMLRRVFLLMLSIAEESEAVLKEETEDLEYLADLESGVNNFTDYCMRLVNKHMQPNFNKGPALYALSFLLELLADHYKDFFNYMASHKVHIKKKPLSQYKKVNDIFRLVYELHFKFDKNKLMKIGRARDAVFNELHKEMDSTTSPKQMRVLTQLEHMLELIMAILDQTLLFHS